MRIKIGPLEVEVPNWLMLVGVFIGASMYNSRRAENMFSTTLREFSKPQNIFDVPPLHPKLKEQLDKMPTPRDLPEESIAKPRNNQ